MFLYTCGKREKERKRDRERDVFNTRRDMFKELLVIEKAFGEQQSKQKYLGDQEREGAWPGDWGI